MSIKRITAVAAAVAAVVAATVISLVAASSALYAAVLPALGAAGASAVVAAAFAVVAVIAALSLGMKARPKTHHASPAQDESLAMRAFHLAREKPLVTAGLGAVAAAVLIRNPGLISTLLTAVVAGKAAQSDR